MNKPMSVAQAAQQKNRTSGGRYAEKVATDPGSDVFESRPCIGCGDPGCDGDQCRRDPLLEQILSDSARMRRQLPDTDEAFVSAVARHGGKLRPRQVIDDYDQHPTSAIRSAVAAHLPNLPGGISDRLVHELAFADVMRHWLPDDRAFAACRSYDRKHEGPSLLRHEHGYERADDSWEARYRQLWREGDAMNAGRLQARLDPHGWGALDVSYAPAAPTLTDDYNTSRAPLGLTTDQFLDRLGGLGPDALDGRDAERIAAGVDRQPALAALRRAYPRLADSEVSSVAGALIRSDVMQIWMNEGGAEAARAAVDHDDAHRGGPWQMLVDIGDYADPDGGYDWEQMAMDNADAWSREYISAWANAEVANRLSRRTSGSPIPPAA